MGGFSVMKQMIDDYLKDHKEITVDIEKIADNYQINDFVKVDKLSKAYFNGEKLPDDIKGIYGCLFSERENRLLLDADGPERRLVNEYMELIREVISAKDRSNSVFYIIAFHYLTLCKEWGYLLTEAQYAPFTFFGKEISPRAKRTYEKYLEIYNDDLRALLCRLSMNDLIYYNSIYREFGYYHHATKHFSLLNYMIGAESITNRLIFSNVLEKLLDVFIFRYKAIYTTEYLGIYTNSDIREKVIKSLINIENRE